MKFLQTSLLILVSLFQMNISFAQQKKDIVAQAFDSKVSELYTKYKLDGFVTYKGGDLKMEKNTEYPIFMDLTEGRWYQFMVVGDPEAKKIEMKLGLEGYGDFITDKFRTVNANEYWTTFSFICPRSGRYLMTFFQRGPRKDLQGHVAIMQRLAKTEQGTYTFK